MIFPVTGAICNQELMGGRIMIRPCLFLRGLAALLLGLPATSALGQVPLNIGLLVELTGQFASNGRACKFGHEIARELYAPNDAVHGLKVRLVYGNSQGAAAAGVTEFQRMVNMEHVAAVIVTRSPVGMAINPISLEKQIPLLGIVGHPGFTAQNKYAFRVWPSALREGEALAEKAFNLGKKTADVITSEDDYFLSITDDFVAGFKRLGGTISKSDTVLASEQEFAGVLSRLTKEPTSVLLINVGPSQYPVLLRRIAEQKFPQQLMANFLVSMPEVVQSSGPSSEGVMFAELDFEQANFLRKYAEHTGGERPTSVGYACFIALATILQAIDEHPAVSNSTSLYDALLKASPIKLPDGEVSYSNREANLDLKLRRIRGGKVESIQ